MKRSLYSLSVLGVGSLLFLGLTVLDSHAGENCNPKHPLRGLWSFDHFVPSFGPDRPSPHPPIPVTEIGNLNMDECGNFEGHGLFNAPNLVGALDFNGHCETPEAGLLNCTVNAPAIGLMNGLRACVASHAPVRPLLGNWGVVQLRAIECETLRKALAGAGQLVHQERRKAPRPRAARAALERASGAASVRVTRKYKPLQLQALCATIGYL